jgi:hypothetical protein
MFDLADAAKAMAQFEHASGASPEATTQLVPLTMHFLSAAFSGLQAEPSPSAATLL